MQTRRGVRRRVRAASWRRAGGALVVTGLVVGLVAGRLAAETDDPRERTLALFGDIAAAEEGFSLRAWVNRGAGEAIPIGSDLAYHFESQRDAWLTVVHLDAHGVSTLLLPNGAEAAADSDRVAPGTPSTFPAPSADFMLRAEPPVGQEHVIVIATAKPLPPEDLGLTLQPDSFMVLEAADGPRLAARLLDLYLETPVADRAAVRIEQQIAGRVGGTEYSSVDIVDYFTTRTRSIKRPRLDLHIHFATDSDVLDGAAQENLDQVAEALSDPKLEAMRFLVAGHTDDTGTAPYNKSLSERRAQRVVEYLVDTQGIEAERLEITSYGETRPLESNETRAGRQMNRRVEFELVR